MTKKGGIRLNREEEEDEEPTAEVEVIPEEEEVLVEERVALEVVVDCPVGPPLHENVVAS